MKTNLSNMGNTRELELNRLEAAWFAINRGHEKLERVLAKVLCSQWYKPYRVRAVFGW